MRFIPRGLIALAAGVVVSGGDSSLLLPDTMRNVSEPQKISTSTHINIDGPKSNPHPPSGAVSFPQSDEISRNIERK